jgi:Domain of unknown function (DUF4149)
MTTRHLLALFDSIYLLAMAAMVGSIVFFSFAVAPIIFRVLGTEAGGRFVRALFPRYYLWGAICGAIALPAFVAGPLCFPEYRGIAVGIQSGLLLCCTLTMLYGGNSLVPEINRARDEGEASHERFERLHRRSVRLNALVLIIGVALVVGYAWRPAPRTAGIIELSPIERARRAGALEKATEGGDHREAPGSAGDASGSMHTGEP